MGLFKVILGGLGFKQEDEQKTPVYNKENADNKKVVPIKHAQTTENKGESIGINNLNCYAPKSNSEVKQLIDSLRRGEACIINLQGLNANDKTCVLDYLGGATYALEASLSRLQGDLYVISPKGLNITSM